MESRTSLRIIRYHKGAPRLACIIPQHENPTNLEIWVDSDWAGDNENRRSCSGGFLRVGETIVAFWSKTQSNIALSSGEAELNAAVKGVSEGIGIWELMCELTWTIMQMSLHVDSSTCKGMLLRHGSGKVKHLTTKQLWVQGAIQAYEMTVSKVRREENTAADSLTHESTRHALMFALKAMGYLELESE